MPVRAVLCMAVVSLCQVRSVVAALMWSSWQFSENDSLSRLNRRVAIPILFFDSAKPTPRVSLRSPPPTRPTKLTSVESVKSWVMARSK